MEGQVGLVLERCADKVFGGNCFAAGFGAQLFLRWGNFQGTTTGLNVTQLLKHRT